jgi:hypothetical protein
LDYDPVTLAAKGLLVEEQRTNLFTQSQYNASVWNIAAGSITVTANYAVSPDGTTNATRLLVGGSSAVMRISSSAITPGSTYAFSFWVKSNTASNYTLVLDVGDSSSQQVTATPQWQRVSIVAAAGSSGNFADIDCIENTDISVYQAQIELGAFATSIIPTSGAPATRLADVASVSTQAFPYSATEGSLVASFTPVNVAAARRAAQLDDATENERITLGTNSTPNGLMTVIDGGSSQASIATGTPAANTTMKLASRYKLDDFAVSANGAAVGTDTSGTLPTVTTLRLGSGTSSTEPLNGWLRQITYIPRALTNAELVARST